MHVANKTGGGGQTAMAYLVEKAGDTHTISLYTGIWISNPLMLPEAKTTMKDLTSLVRLLLEPGLIVVKSDSPFRTFNDFIDEAKRNPGTLKQSGSLVGGRDWMLRVLLMKQTGANWAFIPFPVMGERLGALLGGHTNILLVDPQETGEHIRAGTLRVIVQVADNRLPPYPNVPTMKEAGFDVPNLPVVRGVVAPPGIPREAVAYWEGVFAKLVRTPAWKKYLEDNVLEDGFQRSAEQSKFFDEYAETMRGVMREGASRSCASRSGSPAAGASRPSPAGRESLNHLVNHSCGGSNLKSRSWMFVAALVLPGILLPVNGREFGFGGITDSMSSLALASTSSVDIGLSALPWIRSRSASQ